VPSCPARFDLLLEIFGHQKNSGALSATAQWYN
jgi:hypothetical protein